MNVDGEDVPSILGEGLGDVPTSDQRPDSRPTDQGDNLDAALSARRDEQRQTQISPQTQTPPDNGHLLMGRFDVSTPEGLAAADQWARQQQSEKDSALSALGRLEPWSPLINKIETDQETARRVLDAVQGREAEPDSGDPADTTPAGRGNGKPPELKVRVKVDELTGLPSEEGEIDQESLAAHDAYVIEQARKAYREESSREKEAAERKRMMEEGIAAFRRENPNVTEEQIRDMVARTRQGGPLETLRMFYHGYANTGSNEEGGQPPPGEIAAEDRGRQQVFDQQQAAASLGPAVGAAGGGGNARPSMSPEAQELQEMLDEDARQGRHSRLDSIFGESRGT